MTLEEFKAEYPDIAKALIEEGRQEGSAAVDAAKADAEEAKQLALVAGAQEERDRIKSVSEQLIPGHEALIESLMYDGKTSGPEAAVKIINAEKKLRADILSDNRDDAPAALPDPSTDDDASTPATKSDLPLDERIKADWDAEPKLRADYDGDFDVYAAYVKAVENGDVKVLRGRDE